MNPTVSPAEPASKPANWSSMTQAERTRWYNSQPYKDTPRSRWEAQRAACVPKLPLPRAERPAPNKFIIRAGLARDLLVKAGMGAQVRIITRDAAHIAGNNHGAYLNYVVGKIVEFKARSRKA